MDDLDVLARDFGYRPQGKSAPMRSSDTSAASSRSASAAPPSPFNDVFSAPPKSSSMNDFDYDSIFKSSSNIRGNSGSSKSTSKTTSDGPVYDKPVYDDDIFEGLPGLKSKSVSSSAPMKFEEDVFASIVSSPKKKRSGGDQFDDLLGNLGGNSREEKSAGRSGIEGMEDFLGSLGRKEEKSIGSGGGGVGGMEDLLGGLGRKEGKSDGRSGSSRDFDDLLGGFGSDGPAAVGNRYFRFQDLYV